MIPLDLAKITTALSHFDLGNDQEVLEPTAADIPATDRTHPNPNHLFCVGSEQKNKRLQ